MIPYKQKKMYLNKRGEPVVKVLEIVCFIALTLSKDITDTPERHDFWEMVYIESGEAIATSENIGTRLFPGDVILHKPGEAHFIKAVSPNIKAFFISFHSTSKILNTINSQKISLSSEEKKIIYKLYDESRTLFISKIPQLDKNGFMSVGFQTNYPIGAEQVIKNYIELLLICIFRILEKKDELVTYNSKEELDKILFQKILEKISNSIYSDFTPEQLVSEFNYSRTYIYSVFKKYSGVPIMQYYNHLKIEDAKKMILQKKFTLSQISEKLGFKNQYYFSRTFKRIQGISPSEYITRNT